MNTLPHDKIETSKENSMTESLKFLSGGGEMGALMRAYNWQSSLIGRADKWPQSLLTTLGILLNSKFPMFLFWGSQHVCFYNDAYRPSLGNEGKHPSMLGMKGEEAWPEIWHIIKPLINQVLTDGEATWSEDQLIPIYRNAKIEDVYWTFSYSPVKDESGLPVGVFVACTETTEKVNNFHKIAESNNQLEFAIEATELGTWDYNPLTNKFTGNTRFKDWFGLPHGEEIDLSIGMNVIAENDRNLVAQAFQRTMQYESGGLYDIEYSTIHPVTKQERIVRAKGRAWFGEDKTAYRFNGTLQDITEQASARKEIEASEAFNRTILENSPDCLKVLDREGRIQYINFNGLYQMEIDDFSTFKNKKWWTLWGSENEALVKASVDKALRGETAQFTALRLTAKGIPKWWDVVVSPIGKPGEPVQQIISVSRDVTEKKKSEEAIEKMAAHLKHATDSAGVGTWSLNLQTQKLEWSVLHKKMWGYDEHRNDLTYEDWHKLILPADKELAFKRVEDARINHSFYEVEYRINKADDNVIRSIRSVGKYYYNDKGQAETLTGISVDITEQKQTEEKIKESEERFRSLAETLPHLVWMTDEKGKYEYASSQWEKYSGLDPLKEETWQQLIYPDDMQTMMVTWEKSLITGIDYHAEARLKNKQGEYLWHIVHGIAIKSKEDKIVKWIGTFTNIHDQKIKEEKKDEFISIASHELKTPLTIAKTYIQLLSQTFEESGKEKERELIYAKKANASIDRLNRLISELLDVSKIQSGNLPLHITSFNFDEMFIDTIENLQHTLPKHSIKYSGETKKQVSGDKERLQQVIINLINNATKYSPNADKIFVHISDCENGEIKVEIKDSGIGISKNDLGKIFERYYRVENMTGQFQGLGIGLFISSEIIRRHNGKVWAKSELGAGSTFYFTLPC